MKKLTQNKLEFIVAILFILIGVALRLVPHAPNFTPITAIALFSGVYLSKRIAVIIPILAMLLSDIFLGFYEPKIMLSVYGSFVLCAVLGFWLKKHKSWQVIVPSALLSSVLFFFITNFSVFAFSPWYAKTFFGLIQCYTMALPFFRNTLLGDLFYTIVFFGAYELALAAIKKKFKAKENIIVSTGT